MNHICCHCHRELPLEDFRPRGQKGWVDSDGVRRSSQCVECVRAMSRATTAARRRRSQGSMIEARALLPIEPFRDWIIKKKREFDCAHPHVYYGRHGDGMPGGRFPEYIGVSERYIGRILTREQRTVSLNVVDAALTHEGSTGLWELYPALYEEEEVAA